MIIELFGNYLIGKGKLDADKFSKLKEHLNTTRVKLGLIAVAEGMLTKQQADEVNNLQAVKDKRFGDIAVEMGYLSAVQVGDLLDKQGNTYLKICQALSDLDFLSLDETENLFLDFATELGVTSDELNEFKSDDTDLITSKFLPEKDALYSNLLYIAVRTINRIVSTDLSIEKAYMVPYVEHENVTYQTMHGDHFVMTGIYSDDDGVLKIAKGYAKFDFDEVDEDALDAVAEFVNIVNGLYATSLSYVGEKTELDVPDYKTDKRSVSSDDDLCLLPLIIEGKKVNIFVSVK